MSIFLDIDRERQAAGISKRILAHKAGFQPQTYNKWVNGVDGITERSLIRLRVALADLKQEQAV